MSLLALLAVALVAAALTFSLLWGPVTRWSAARRRRRRLPYLEGELIELRDPGRERRAEQRARELLRSCVNAEEWAMYRALGFIRVWGKAESGLAEPDPARSQGDPRQGDPPRGDAAPTARGTYAYLIYPHRPIVAYVAETRRLLNEYCVEFPDLTSSISRSRLPDSDDVLAKWMALTGDERRLIRNANMHLPGRQIDPGRVRRDLWRLSEWERERSRRSGRDELDPRLR